MDTATKDKAPPDLRAAMAREDWTTAISIASRYQHLGRQREAITRAQSARLHPGFYRQIGRNPEEAFAAGVAALKERFGSR